MKKRSRVLAVLAACCTFYSMEAMAQKSSAGFYVTPFYDSKGPTVNIGKFSKELAAADKQSIKATVATMKREMAALPAISMFVAAARLYELGYRDESLYWFYMAQYRARLFKALLEPSKIGGMGSPTFELESAHNAFQQTLGEYVNGYAGCDQAKWLAALNQAQAENKTVPSLGKLYPAVAFIPAASWNGENAKINSGLTKLAEYIKANWPEMQTTRKENGLDKEFCND